MREYIFQTVAAIFASVGFWTFINNVWSARKERKSETAKMLLGLGHDRIYELSNCYIERGWISTDEYENLVKYLYEPYKKLGGNGTAERLITEVNKLPLRKEGE